MKISAFHMFRQGPMIATLARVAGSTVTRKIYSQKLAIPDMPGSIIIDIVPPRSQRLVNDYVAHVGGDPNSYKGYLPPHFFPQWGFPILAQTISSLPYDLSRILNGGAQFEVKALIPAFESLKLKAQLMNVDENDRRVIFTQRLVTGTESVPEALIAEVHSVLPLKSKKKPLGTKNEKPTIHENAQEIGQIQLKANAGLDFAKLTGDFNPVHWISAYAKMSGFPNTILHGFSTMARAAEMLIQNRFSGKTDQLQSFASKFVKPLILPNKVSVFVHHNNIWVGHIQGGTPYLMGQFTKKGE
jgi:hypothetical protein